MQSIALVLELVDKRDLKSLAPKGAYGFDPRPEHKRLCKLLIFKHFAKSCFFVSPKFGRIWSLFLPSIPIPYKQKNITGYCDGYIESFVCV